MDDEATYGKVFHTINFSEAVRCDLLVDYKVIVLAVEETHVNRRIQGLLQDENNQLKMNDAAKIIGCWKALTKQGLQEDLNDDSQPMQRAVAFCQVIDSTKSKTHQVSSKKLPICSKPWWRLIKNLWKMRIAYPSSVKPSILMVPWVHLKREKN
ncbi:hypothetical protein [Candidatus Nitrosacidococcus sp. I8]|uniref:hypothetical protein n=1 Tax=Candidatus Nitrosacidococcus sp. I8 TaxID=2942908 RepID=UPI0039B6EBFF